MIRAALQMLLRYHVLHAGSVRAGGAYSGGHASRLLLAVAQQGLWRRLPRVRAAASLSQLLICVAHRLTDFALKVKIQTCSLC